MSEIYKVLEFRNFERGCKYAHPIETSKDFYEWGSSSIPLLMTKETTVEILNEMYRGLDFHFVKLVSKSLNNLE